MSRVKLMDQEEVREEMNRALQQHLGEITDKAERLEKALDHMDGVLTKQRLARLLNVTPATVMNTYVKEQGLPVYRPGKAPIFLLEDVKAWLKEHPDR